MKMPTNPNPHAGELYTAILHSNPFRELRSLVGLTQEEVAKLLYLNGPQYVYRHENGLVNSPSPNYAKALLSRLSEDNLNERVDITIQKYMEWVEECRKFIRKCGIDYSKLLHGPYQEINPLRDVQPFTSFMFNFNTVFGSIISYEGDFRSQQLFNRFLCLHPRTVQLFMGAKQPQVTGLLGTAFIDIGVDDHTIEHIEEAMAKYNKRVFDVKVSKK